MLVLNKVDLLPYVSLDIAAAKSKARQIHREIEIVRVSSQSHEGLQDWLERQRAKPRAVASAG
jgi:hydrogenase nickel incorporation protein HypB